MLPYTPVKWTNRLIQDSIKLISLRSLAELHACYFLDLISATAGPFWKLTQGFAPH